MNLTVHNTGKGEHLCCMVILLPGEDQYKAHLHISVSGSGQSSALMALTAMEDWLS